MKKDTIKILLIIIWALLTWFVVSSCQSKQQQIIKNFKTVPYKGHLYVVNDNANGNFLHDPNCPCLINHFNNQYND